MGNAGSAALVADTANTGPGSAWIAQHLQRPDTVTVQRSSTVTARPRRRDVRQRLAGRLLSTWRPRGERGQRKTDGLVTGAEPARTAELHRRRPTPPTSRTSFADVITNSKYPATQSVGIARRFKYDQSLTPPQLVLVDEDLTQQQPRRLGRRPRRERPLSVAPVRHLPHPLGLPGRCTTRSPSPSRRAASSTGICTQEAAAGLLPDHHLAGPDELGFRDSGYWVNSQNIVDPSSGSTVYPGRVADVRRSHVRLVRRRLYDRRGPAGERSRHL